MRTEILASFPAALIDELGVPAPAYRLGELERHHVVEQRRGAAITYIVARDTAGVAIGLLPVYLSPRTSGSSPGPDLVVAGQDSATGSTVCSAGTPGGYPNNLVVRAEIGHPEAVRGARVMIEAARQVAAVAGYPYVLIPHLDETQSGWLAGLEADSTSTTTREKAVLNIVWDDFDGYLAALPRKRRWQVRQERRAFADSGIVIRDALLKDVATEVAPLLAQTQKRYGKVADVAGMEFYLAMLAMNPGAETRALVGYRGGAPIAFSVLHRCGDDMAVRAFGRDYAAPNDGQYFNLTYYEPITRAAASGATMIDFGLGSLSAKRFRGCRLEPLRSLLIPSTAGARG